MKTKSIVFTAILIIFLLYNESMPCNICGGGTSDIAVLALDGRMLFNLGFTFDHYTGLWEPNGNWRELDYNSNQFKIAAAIAYRLNRHIQFGISMPYVINTSNINGYNQRGNSIGDISVSARYELFHEFQLKKSGNKKKIDNVYPYLAFIFGVTIPTGKSEEMAEREVDVTGKGFYTTSVGVSVIKSIIRNRFQLSADFSWQHSFRKKYDSYFGGPPPFESKQAGDKFNYSFTFNYIFGSEHALSFTASGFAQNQYLLNNISALNTDERAYNFVLAYSYYPHVQFRITPSIKWMIPSNNFGRNAACSTTFNINFSYYMPDYSIK